MRAVCVFSFSVEMSSRIWIANDLVAQNACPILTSHTANVDEQENKGTQICQHDSLYLTSSFPLSYKGPLSPGPWRKPPFSVPTCIGNFIWALVVAADTLPTWTHLASPSGSVLGGVPSKSGSHFYMTRFLTLSQGTLFFF